MTDHALNRAADAQRDGPEGVMGLTLEEFAEQYARSSGMTVEQLRLRGRVAMRCESNCTYPRCKGWQMGRVDPARGTEDSDAER